MITVEMVVNALIALFATTTEGDFVSLNMVTEEITAGDVTEKAEAEVAAALADAVKNGLVAAIKDRSFVQAPYTYGGYVATKLYAAKA